MSVNVRFLKIDLSICANVNRALCTNVKYFVCLSILFFQNLASQRAAKIPAVFGVVFKKAIGSNWRHRP